MSSTRFIPLSNFVSLTIFTIFRGCYVNVLAKEDRCQVGSRIGDGERGMGELHPDPLLKETSSGRKGGTKPILQNTKTRRAQNVWIQILFILLIIQRQHLVAVKLCIWTNIQIRQRCDPCDRYVLSIFLVSYRQPFYESAFNGSSVIEKESPTSKRLRRESSCRETRRLEVAFDGNSLAFGRVAVCMTAVGIASLGDSFSASS